MAVHHTGGVYLEPDFRVTRSTGAIYSAPREARKRRRCDGHLNPVRHWIERGDLIVWSALPPGDDDIGNSGWWHAAYCADCAPTFGGSA